MNRSLIFALVSLTVGCNTPMDLGGKIRPASVATGGACTQDADCVTGDHCANQACVPAGTDGTTCTANNQCTSGVCGSAGSGHCCTVACAAASDAGCFPSDCDSTGACVYPAASGCPCGKDTDCKDTRICVQGACVFPGTGVCFIQGQFITNGDYNPANSCENCEPILSDIDWTTNFKVASTTVAQADAGYLTGPWPFSSTVGGAQDSVLVGEVFSQQLILLQGGSTVQTTIPVGSLPGLLAVIDLNGDGFNDLVVAGIKPTGTGDGLYDNLISLFLNDTDGGFTAGATYSFPQNEWDGGNSTSHYLEHMGVGDFNGGGSQAVSLGVATSIYENSSYFAYTQLEIYALDGDGGLAAPTPVTQQVAQQGAQRLGDFNEDGKTDILLWAPGAGGGGTDGGSGPFPLLALLLSNGDGGFSETSAPVPGSPPYLEGTIVGDFNGDGHLDVTFVNADGTISVELGDGQGNFGPAKSSGLPEATNGLQPFLVAGDFNGDGHLDLARLDVRCLSSPCDQTATIWLGVGDGTFLAPGPAIPPPSLPVGWSVYNAGASIPSTPLAALATSGGRPDLALAYDYQIDSLNSRAGTAVLHNGCK